MVTQTPTDPNVESVRKQLRDRARAGLLKYGVDTTRADLTHVEWLRHAQEESLDLAVYLERCIANSSPPGIDVQALIAAAHEIDRKAELNEQRARRFGELARAAKSVTPGSPEHQALIQESKQLSCTVVDFGDAINALRKALRS